MNADTIDSSAATQHPESNGGIADTIETTQEKLQEITLSVSDT